MPDAVVIGAGHNGLVAANRLADAGWSVVVLEAQPEPGGAVRTGELTLPGFHHDLFSGFYPLGVASPVIRSLDLDAHGLRWRRAPLSLAHPTPDGRCVVLSTDLDETAASLDDYAPGDGDAWRRLYARWEGAGAGVLDALCSPFPPVAGGLRLARRLGLAEGLRTARLGLMTVRRLVEEEFTGEGAAVLLGGNALHCDIAPEAAGSAIFGWLLASLGQQVGFPVPEGGAGALTAALVRRLEARGGEVVCGARVTSVVVRRGRAVAVRTADGGDVVARRAVLADVGAPALYRELVGPDHVPSRLLDDLGRFEYDPPTVKVDWALSGSVPWTAVAARRAGVVHVAESLDEMSQTMTDLATGTIPGRPFVLFGQQSVADPTRAPAGSHTGWAYAHVPRRTRRDGGDPGGLTGRWGDRAEADAFADRMEERVERLAPGFRDLVLARHVMSPAGMEAADANLVGGALNGGTAQLHQQLVFRPTPGLGRPTTPVKGLFLASSSAHPGGGVHGACGANAAHAALASGLRRLVGRAVTRIVERRIW
jgi:phytoene dehydrogenase-like protein